MRISERSPHNASAHIAWNGLTTHCRTSQMHRLSHYDNTAHRLKNSTAHTLPYHTHTSHQHTPHTWNALPILTWQYRTSPQIASPNSHTSLAHTHTHRTYHRHRMTWQLLASPYYSTTYCSTTHKNIDRYRSIGKFGTQLKLTFPIEHDDLRWEPLQFGEQQLHAVLQLLPGNSKSVALLSPHTQTSILAEIGGALRCPRTGICEPDAVLEHPRIVITRDRFRHETDFGDAWP